LLGYQRSSEDAAEDPVALLPASGDGPGEQVERREDIARSREALQALKPAELRALGLLAEGYSYAEIGEQTGYSRTKINRLLAEGRARFRALVSSSEDGSRCRDMQPLLSSFCDGEAGPREAIEVREHLRACAHCRATMRAYRAAPRAAAALLPLLPPSRSLLERVHDLAANLGARLPGFGGGDSVAAQIAAAGGSRGAGMAAIAKLLTVCAGAAGGAAACVATGVLPAPALVLEPTPKPSIERPATSAAAASEGGAVDYQPAPAPAEAPPSKPVRQSAAKQEADASVDVEPSAETAGAVEYEAPAPEPPSSGEVEPAPTPSGSAAGEFGP
jgi:DNA-binding CsgD family transcriptional regulator